MKYIVKKGCEDLQIWGNVAGQTVIGKQYQQLNQRELQALYESGNEFIDQVAEEVKTEKPGDAKSK